MSLAFYIRVYSNYPTHPKTVHLKLKIGPMADVFPVRLWTWAAQFAQNGIIRGGAPMIEAVLGWTGKASELHKALMSYPEGYTAGFLEKDGITIHDWMDGTGGALKAYAAKVDANARYYASRRSKKTEKPKTAQEIVADLEKEGTPL